MLPNLKELEMIKIPRKFKHPCSHPGCPELTDKKYCNKHSKLYKRESTSKRGYDSRWRKARLIYLKANPLCVKCLAKGKLVAATVVDHKQPHRGDDKLFWDINNWQALCKSCHDRKTRTEDQYPEYKF